VTGKTREGKGRRVRRRKDNGKKESKGMVLPQKMGNNIKKGRVNIGK
jgi:hypothetical protein